MKRDPSIHIKASDLAIILEDILGQVISDYPKLTHLILAKARAYSMGSRSLIVSNDQIQKKANAITRSSQADADTMAMTILMVRRKLKHVGVRLIEPTSKDWALVKNVTDLANQFCGEFLLKKREGYRLFLEIGMAKMEKFNLPKLTAMYSSVCESYAAMKEIEQDPTPSESEAAHVYYRYKIASKTGIVNTYKNLPDKYVYFCRVTALAKALGITTKSYIDAQFAMMEYRGAVPDPMQLVGDKAKDRLNKYLYKQS